VSASHCRYAEDVNPAFPAEIMARPGGEGLLACIQCGTCSGACPLSVYMDYTPRRIIALTRAGLERDVLQSVTPWLCASCYECQVACPRGLKVTDIMYALKARAIRKGLAPRRLPVAVLAREFSALVRRTGRSAEARLVALMFLKTRPLGLLRMLPQGYRLWRTGRLPMLRQDRIRQIDQIRTVLDAVEES
jgi:heterodisulfide reductase subunit C